MNALTRELFSAAHRGDLDAVRRLLEDPRVDVLARNAGGELEADRIGVGNVTMDVREVAELQHGAQLIRAAAQRALLVKVENAPNPEVEQLVRSHVARTVPSPANNGGGSLSVRCLRAVEASPETKGEPVTATDTADGSTLRLVVEGDYHGALPSADPPWQLRAELLVLVDPAIGLRELTRLRWETT